MFVLRLIGVLSLLMCMNHAIAQEAGKRRLSDVLDHYADKYRVMISYQPKMCRRIILNGVRPTMTLHELFAKIEKESAMRIGMIDSMRYYVYSQEPQCYTITGTVTDADTGEALIGAEIRHPNGQTDKTGEFGLYSLIAKKGVCKVHVTYPGYTDLVKEIKVDAGGIYHIVLSSLNQKLEEVEVVGIARGSSCYSEGGKIEIFLPNDASVASRMGKKNALCILESMPGVTAGNVGKGDLFVRGGNQGSNGFYIDGAPVYSINHLYGVNSVFNTNAIDKIEMYKGNIPSRYGNYTGSITEFFLKNGDMQTRSGEFTVGNFMSDVILQGPIQKGKSSYIVSLRHAYPNLYSGILPQGNYARFSFSDVYAKLNLIAKGRNRLFLSFFYAGDAARLNATTLNQGPSYDYIKRAIQLRWTNLMFSFRWNKIISEKLFVNTTLYFSKYAYATREDQTKWSVHQEKHRVEIAGEGRFFSDISDYGLSVQGKWFPESRHQVRAGFTLSKKNLRPVDYVFKKTYYAAPLIQSRTPNEVFNYWGYTNTNLFEFSLYGEDEFKVGTKLQFVWGVRSSGYTSRSKTFAGIFPFLQVHYKLNDAFSFYGGYASSMQTMRLLPSTNVLYSFASSVWFPAEQHLKPELNQILDASVTYKHAAFRVTGSYFLRYKKHDILWNIHQQSSGLFNKDMYSIGTGLSWGAETLLQAQQAGYNMQLAYTLGYNNERASEYYTNQWHRAFNDIRHSLDISINRFFLSGRIEAGAMWSFRSGSPYTQAQIRQVVNQNGTLINVEDYSCRNNAQFRNTHYLNLNMNYHFDFAHKIRSTLSIGIYNVYYRQNPYDSEKIYDRSATSAQIIGYREVSIAPMIPYISLTLKL